MRGKRRRILFLGVLVPTASPAFHIGFHRVHSKRFLWSGLVYFVQTVPFIMKEGLLSELLSSHFE